MDFNILPFILQDSVLESLKNTRRFKEEGSIWFYGFALEGSERLFEHSEGLFYIDYTAKRPEDVFRKSSTADDWKNFEFHNRMRLFKGPYPMQVGIYSEKNNGNDAFVEIHCSLKPVGSAPATVHIEKPRISTEKQHQINLAVSLMPYIDNAKGILDPKLYGLLVEIAKSLRK